MDDLELYIDLYYEARKTKRRNRICSEYEIHLERNLYNFVNELKNHSYTPSTFSFLVYKPKIREIFACDLNLRLIDLRLAHAMDEFIEKNLTIRTFNNRIGYGTQAAVNTVIQDIYDVSEGYTKDAWCIKLDMVGFFPNASHQIAYNKMSSILEQYYRGSDKDELRYLLMLSMFTSATDHCTRQGALSNWDLLSKEKSLFNKPPGIGGIIGRERWQTAMNLYLNDLDHLAIDQWNLRWSRFVDDIVIVTDNKECVLSLIKEIKKELDKVHVNMHTKKFYCQHYKNGVEFLGTVIKPHRNYVNNRIVYNFRNKIKEFNRHPKLSLLDDFVSSMNSYMGIFNSHCSHNIIKKYISTINSKWLKFCRFDGKKFIIKEPYKYKNILLNKYKVNTR